jgi:5-(carboxyamino)imidazole ribonucleotide mutase
VRTENEGQASSVGHHPVLRVGIVMGSETDLVWMQQSAEALKKFGVAYEMQIISAHRTPSILAEYGASARTKGIRVIIAGAGGAAHLPGMMAAQTNVPVIGVPCPVGAMRGEDALWSIVQMPKGVPVATVAIGGGWNAGVLAAQIIATGDSLEARAIAEKLAAYKFEMASAVARMNERL